MIGTLSGTWDSNSGGIVDLTLSGSTEQGIFEDPQDIMDIFILQSILAFVVLFVIGIIAVLKSFNK